SDSQNIFSLSVELKGGDVARRGTFDFALFVWRKPRLQLIGNGLCDLTLNREYVRKIAVISLCPKLPVGACIGQLGIDPHAIASTLNASLQHMRHAKCHTNFAQVAWRAGLVLQCR